MALYVFFLFLGGMWSRLTSFQDFAVDGGMSKAYVTAEGPGPAGPVNNALKDKLDS